MRINSRFKKFGKLRNPRIPTWPVPSTSVGAQMGIAEQMPHGDAVTLTFLANDPLGDCGQSLTVFMTASEAEDVAARLQVYAAQVRAVAPKQTAR